MRSLSVVRLCILGTAFVGCGKQSDGPTAPGASGFAAKVDGTAWAPLTSSAVWSGNGIFVLSSVSLAGSMTFSLWNVGGPGTYLLGVGPSVFGGLAQVVLGNQGWGTPQSGAAGTMTITTLTTTRIAGTFNFVATALTGGATGTKTVTDGSFDVPVTTVGSPGALSDGAGSRVSATFGTTAFSAAAVSGVVATTTSLSFAAVSENRSITVLLAGLNGPGTYALQTANPARTIGVSSSVPVAAWTSGTTGTVTITSLTSTRVKGTFSATLAPGLGTTSALAITNGVFDLGLRP